MLNLFYTKEVNFLRKKQLQILIISFNILCINANFEKFEFTKKQG